MKKLIAELSEGVFLPASNIKPGKLTEMKMAPTDTRVQVKTTVVVSFRTTHSLKGDAGVKVRLPYELKFPQGATEVDVILPHATVKGKVDG